MAEAAGLLLLNAEDQGTSGLTITVGGSNTVTTDASAALHGSYGYLFSFLGTSSLAYFYKSFTERSEVFARCYFSIPSSLDYLTSNKYFYILKLRDGTVNIIRPRFLYNYSTDAVVLERIYYFVNGGEAYASINQTLSRNTLYCLELHYKSDASAGEIHVYLDETARVSLTGLATSTYVPDGIRVGNDHADVPVSGSEIFIDDIKVNSSYIGVYTEVGGTDQYVSLAINSIANFSASAIRERLISAAIPSLVDSVISVIRERYVSADIDSISDYSVEALRERYTGLIINSPVGMSISLDAAEFVSVLIGSLAGISVGAYRERNISPDIISETGIDFSEFRERFTVLSISAKTNIIISIVAEYLAAIFLSQIKIKKSYVLQSLPVEQYYATDPIKIKKSYVTDKVEI